MEDCLEPTIDGFTKFTILNDWTNFAIELRNGEAVARLRALVTCVASHDRLANTLTSAPIFLAVLLLTAAECSNIR